MPYSRRDDEKPDADEIRTRIIGLGAGSARKSYYPQLQEKIRDLESKQLELMDLVRTLEEREAMLEQAVDEKNALLREVHHRVKNNFQIIGSLLNLGLGAVANNAEARPFLVTKQRLDTMAMVYGHLLQADRFSDVNLYELVIQLVDALKCDTDRPGIELSYGMDCADFYVDIEQAIPLALIVNEVASNSFCHAFPDGHGKLTVRIAAVAQDENGGKCRLFELEDNGCGFPGGVMPALSGSLGLTLIDSLASQLNAIWRYQPGTDDRGLRFSLYFR